MNAQGSRTSLSTATILIDRALGILGMVIVSISALILLGREFTVDLQEFIPEKWHMPIFLILLILVAVGGILLAFWLQKPKQSGRLIRAWNLVKENVGLLVIALLISIAAHIIFSLAHYFLFVELHPLSPLEVIAVVLTPQLARSIPVSILGISAGEGLMVASQMMVGVARETALIITFISLTSRYFFAFLGFLIEFLEDGMKFFRNKPSNKITDNPTERE